MRNLVTGGAGFIGSNLIEKLMSAGEEVICLDDLSTGNILNLSKWIKNERFQFIQSNIVEEVDIGVDIIWHLACPASPVHYQKKSLETLKTCFLGTLNMLELANVNKAKLIFTSSSEVYGEPKEHPQSETYRGYVDQTGIRSCYTEGKRIAESLCFEFLRSYKTKVHVVRIFNAYGPYMKFNDGRVISNFIIQALQGKPLTIYGNGNQTRSFCYIDDVVEGLIKFKNIDYYGPVNIGNPDQEYSILELANIVKEKINPKLLLRELPLPQDDPMKRKPLIRLAQSLLSWKPSISLEEGLDKTIEYFKGVL